MVKLVIEKRCDVML